MGKKESTENDYVRRALTLDAVESLVVDPPINQQNVESTQHQQRYALRERKNNKELQQNDAGPNDHFKKGAFYAAVKRKLTLTQTNVEKVIKQRDKELFNHMKSLTDKQREKRLSDVPKKYFNEYDEFIKKGAALPLDQRAKLSELVTKICEGIDKSGELSISSEHLNEIHSWWRDHIDSNTNAADRVLPLMYVSNDPTRRAVDIAFGSGFSATENGGATDPVLQQAQPPRMSSNDAVAAAAPAAAENAAYDPEAKASSENSERTAENDSTDEEEGNDEEENNYNEEDVGEEEEEEENDEEVDDAVDPFETADYDERDTEQQDTIAAGPGTSIGGGIVSLTSVSDTGSSGTVILKTANAAGSGAGSSSGDLNLATGSASTAKLSAFQTVHEGNETQTLNNETQAFEEWKEDVSSHSSHGDGEFRDDLSSADSVTSVEDEAGLDDYTKFCEDVGSSDKIQALGQYEAFEECKEDVSSHSSHPGNEETRDGPFSIDDIFDEYENFKNLVGSNGEFKAAHLQILEMISNEDIYLQDLIDDETFKLLFNIFNENSESEMSSEAFLRIVTIDLYHYMKHSLDDLYKQLGLDDSCALSENEDESSHSSPSKEEDPQSKGSSVGTSVIPTPTKDDEEENALIKDLRNQLQTLKEEKDALQEENEFLREQMTNIGDGNSTLRRDFQTLQEENNTLQTVREENETLRAQIETLKKEKKKTEGQLDALFEFKNEMLALKCKMDELQDEAGDAMSLAEEIDGEDFSGRIEDMVAKLDTVIRDLKEQKDENDETLTRLAALEEKDENEHEDTKEFVKETVEVEVEKQLPALVNDAAETTRGSLQQEFGGLVGQVETHDGMIEDNVKHTHDNDNRISVLENEKEESAAKIVALETKVDVLTRTLLCTRHVKVRLNKFD